MKKTFVLLFLIGLSLGIHAQKFTLSFGLSHKQPEQELPKTKADIVYPDRKLKTHPTTKLVETEQPNEFFIRGGWEMLEVQKVIASGESVFNENLNTSEWYNATVPGTVLTTLVEQGVHPDPYFGVNNLFITDTLCRMDWWYRTEIELPQKIQGKRLSLQFDGINYRAEIWFNGKLLGNIAGAFKRESFDITNTVKITGKNILAVRIFPPNNPGIPHEENKADFGPNGGVLCLDGPTFISSEGWDWVPGIRDRNIGLWQDVRLCVDGGVKIIDPFVITDLPLPDVTKADLTIKTGLVNEANEQKTVTLCAKIEDIMLKKEITLKPRESREVILTPTDFPELKLKNPKLWWPNGYGEQNLYNLELIVLDGGVDTNSKNVRFGVREFSYELMADISKDKQGVRLEYSPTDLEQKDIMIFDYSKRRVFDPEYKHTVVPSLMEGVQLSNFSKIDEKADNPHLMLKVNGIPIFIKGGNWGMDDGMKRVSRERLEPFFKFHKDANMNLIRNWTGESTEREFYELCDEYGMLVWNDFWMSTGGKDLEPADDHLFVDNATDVVRRFRSHASIAIWCPRNEGYAPEYLERELYTMVQKEDGTRHYHGNSRIMNSRRSGPWGFNDPMIYWEELAFGFNTELGTLSVPTAETVRKFIAKEDLWPIGDVWYYHNLAHSHFGWQEFLPAIDNVGGTPAQGVDDFCKRAQILNYNGHRDMFEAFNSRMWDNTYGMILWMSHPAWYSMMWQIYTYDGETHGSFYGTKKANEPIHAQWNLNDKKAVLINTSLNVMKNTQFEAKVYDLSGKTVWSKSSRQNLNPNSKLDCFAIDVPENKSGLYLIRLVLKDSKGRMLSENEYWSNREKQSELQTFALLTQTQIADTKVKRMKGKNEDILTFDVKNNSPEIASFLKLNVRDKDGRAILPVYTDEGYFHLLPNEKKTVNMKIPHRLIDGVNHITVEGYNVEQQKIAEL